MPGNKTAAQKAEKKALKKQVLASRQAKNVAQASRDALASQLMLAGQSQGGRTRDFSGGSVATAARISGVLSQLANKPGQAYFGFLRGLVFPQQGGPIPDLTSMPTAWNFLSSQGTLTTDSAGKVQLRVVARPNCLVKMDVGTTTFGVAATPLPTPAGYTQMAQQSAYDALVVARRQTGVCLIIRANASLTNNSGVIAIGQVPTSVGAPYDVSAITQLPSYVTCSVSSLMEKGEIRMWMAFESITTAAGAWRFLDFQDPAISVSGVEPMIVAAIEGAVGSYAAFTMEVQQGLEAITTNQILTPVKAEKAPMESVSAGSLAGNPDFVRAVTADHGSGAGRFVKNIGSFLWDHRSDIAGAGSTVANAAKSVLPYAAPLLMGLL